ncbi:MAG: hypothetical protein RLZZ221_3067 [Verrucomicrobiota bacterium]
MGPRHPAREVRYRMNKLRITLQVLKQRLFVVEDHVGVDAEPIMGSHEFSDP